MKYTICLDKVVHSKFGDRTSGANIYFDANVLKFRYSPTKRVSTYVTHGVMGELSRLPDIFPQESVDQLIKLLDIKTVSEFVPIEDEYMISKVALEYSTKERQERGQIGWVDIQQIGLALDHVRKGKKTIIISNDSDILRTVKGLGKRLCYAEWGLRAFSVRRYIESQHAQEFVGLGGEKRVEKFKEVEMLYKVA